MPESTLSYTRTGNPHLDAQRFVVATVYHPGAPARFMRFRTQEEAEGYTQRAIDRYFEVAYLGEDA